MTKQCKCKLQGLTLIELLVALAILIILMASSTPSYRALVNKNKICHLTRQLVEALNVTRQLSIVRELPHYFTVQVNNSLITAVELCWVISQLENCDCFTSSALCQSKYGQVSAVKSGIEIVTNRPHLSFSPLFGMTNGATYQLSLGRFSTKIIVSTQGRIRVCMVRGESAIYAPC
ncbi:prepilin-type N-terminal cleavage/methylation domain-containing protein [Moritella sp. 5]|uniref:prepilin-type N-terminal cleavage/methylation domain-containing protein n=1 Tax=Moritella sp. 5 TaxID=2746231 RepID=UPI001BA801CD|nr:prepilin-type N-terminal cleavage/methylation domain-containing protein [Moritella sp. 5]QUM82071.1 prepilin-type N-terminal cleavage/methylation domain-containing protein [Moritella sp. 5]